MIAEYAHANPHFSPSYGQLKKSVVVFNDLKNIGLKTCDWTGVEEVSVVCDHDWQPDCEGVYECSKCGELCELD